MADSRAALNIRELREIPLLTRRFANRIRAKKESAKRRNAVSDGPPSNVRKITKARTPKIPRRGQFSIPIGNARDRVFAERRRGRVLRARPHSPEKALPVGSPQDDEPKRTPINGHVRRATGSRTLAGGEA